MIEHNQLTPGKVVRKHGTPRSYIVETLGGKRLRRNRKQLKGTKALFQPESEIEHSNTNLKKTLLIEQEITNEPTDIAENRIIDNEPIEITQSVQTPKKKLWNRNPLKQFAIQNLEEPLRCRQNIVIMYVIQSV